MAEFEEIETRRFFVVGLGHGIWRIHPQRSLVLQVKTAEAIISEALDIMAERDQSLEDLAGIGSTIDQDGIRTYARELSLDEKLTLSIDYMGQRGTYEVFGAESRADTEELLSFVRKTGCDEGLVMEVVDDYLSRSLGIV